MEEEIRNSAATVGASSIQVAPPLIKGQRNAITIVNVSTAGQNISLSWGQEATANIGIVLYPGGSWSESYDSAFIPSNLGIWAVSSAANGVLAIHERIRR
jgi:hypothetical protein